MVAERQPAAAAQRFERPIMFKGANVRAILAGEKTQTRRVVSPQPTALPGGRLRWSRHGPAFAGGFEWGAREECRFPTPYGQAGDRLWLREAAYLTPPGWGPASDCTHRDQLGRPRLVVYAADCRGGRSETAEVDYNLRKTPAMLFPRWACRAVLEVLRVRVQRLQDITEAEIRAEGVTLETAAEIAGVERREVLDLEHAWELGWDAINGSRSWHRWEANPFVWVVEFRRLP